MWMTISGTPDVWLNVGWDQNLETFYAVCWDFRDIDRGPIFHLGTVRAAISTPLDLASLMPLRPLPEEAMISLQRDKEHGLSIRKAISLPQGLRERLDTEAADRHLDIPDHVYRMKEYATEMAKQHRDVEREQDVERQRPKRDRMH
jgi:hypothetical protein